MSCNFSNWVEKCLGQDSNKEPLAKATNALTTMLSWTKLADINHPSNFIYTGLLSETAYRVYHS